MTFWTKIAGFILRNRYFVLILITVITGLLLSQTKHMRFSYTEANLLPTDHKANVEYDNFLKIFGEEGNLIILGVKDSTIFSPNKFKKWNLLTKSFEKSTQVDFTLSISDVKKLKANRAQRKFEIEPLFNEAPNTTEGISNIKKQLFERYLFMKTYFTIKKEFYKLLYISRKRS